MDVPVRPGDPLAQPTRAKLFALLGELRRPAGTEELAERLSLHANGVRNHLEQLEAAGLVTRGRERRPAGSRGGRPRDVWSLSAEAQPGGDPPTAYADLGRWLVRAIAAGGVQADDIEAAGRQIGRELAPAGDDAPAEARLHASLVSLGFQPRREREPGAGERLTYRLCNCPYRDAVRERQQVVCGLHRGLTRGLLDRIDPDTRLSGFVPKDPDVAGCLIEVQGPLAADAETDEPA